MRLRYKLLIVLMPVLIVAILGLAFGIQAKSELSYLRNKVNNLEVITDPPHVNVLSGELGMNGTSESISKLIIEELGLETIVRVEIANKTNQTKSYGISNRKSAQLMEGYKELDINSPYIVTPLTNYVVIDAMEKKPIVILINKLDAESYYNTESWISVLENTNSPIQNELVLRILIKGQSKP